MVEFWASIFKANEGVLTCAQMDVVFFTGGCNTGNRLARIWNAIPGSTYWDMIGMSGFVNNEYKGSVSKLLAVGD